MPGPFAWTIVGGGGRGFGGAATAQNPQPNPWDAAMFVVQIRVIPLTVIATSTMLVPLKTTINREVTGPGKGVGGG